MTYPVAGTTLADKRTTEEDSYGNRYPDGMTEGSAWVWNVNAVSVSGTVKDQDGEPVEGATVVLKMDNEPDRSYGCQTDANGNWTVGVMPGSYTVTAMYEYDIDHIYTANETVPITVEEQDKDGIDLTMTRYDLSGTVVRAGDNAPMAGVNITISYSDGTPVWTGVTESDGRFNAPLWPDTYVLKAESNGTVESQNVTLDADKDISLSIRADILLTGTVYDTDGKTPVKDGIVTFTGKDRKSVV